MLIKERKDRNFKVGEWVYLKLQPYRQQSTARRRNSKLSWRFYGPYQICQKIGSQACKLSLSEGPANPRSTPV